MSLSRRDSLKTAAAGFALPALADLLTRETSAAKPPPIAPMAKRVIFLFMYGGPSSIDTFDYKPQLEKDHGKPLPFNKPRLQFRATKNLFQSPWTFRQYGQSGTRVSDLFPHVAQHADKLSFVHSLHGSNAAHGGALLKIHTGTDIFVRPSMGAWVGYGLGSLNQNLPGFVVLNGGLIPAAQAIAHLVDYVKSRPGANELYVSYIDHEEGPAGFYRGLGFRETGEVDEEEVEMKLELPT